MKSALIVVLLPPSSTQGSTAAPTRSPSGHATKEAVERSHSPLSSLIKRRPSRHISLAGIQFKQDFASHPDIKKLQDLPEKEYIEYADELNAKLAAEDGYAKLKFTKALERYMIDTGVSQKQQALVKARLLHETERRTGVETVKKRLQEDSEAYKRMREKYKASLRRQTEIRKVQGLRKEDKGDIDEEMKSVGITEESTASDVEKLSRKLYPENKRKATARLKVYFDNHKRFTPTAVRNAVVTRKRLNNLTSRAQRRRVAKERKQPLEEGGSRGTTVEAHPIGAPLADKPWWDEYYR